MIMPFHLATNILWGSGGRSAPGGAHVANDAGGPAPRPAASPRDISGQKKDDSVIWLSDAKRDLKKIPFFVRGKAKAHYAR